MPVIILKWAKIPEEVGRYAIKVNDEDEMAYKIYEIITNEDYAKKISERGINYVKKTFSWKKTVEKTLKVYERVLNTL